MNTTKVKDLMTKKIISVNNYDSVITASEIMIENNIGCVIVYKDLKPIGIITERDIVKKVISDCRDLCDVPASTIATKKLITIAPTDTIEHALLSMHRNRIKRILVKDPDTQDLKGIITTRDIIAAFSTLELT
ncbi:MAG: CBS domain-containing protein [Candidatus Hodarchaeales archaeon]